MSPASQLVFELPAVTVPQVLGAAGVQVVDLRAPAEFAADHLPGASNVPLFSDVDRALIGTLYKRVSPDAAFEAGRGRVRERVAQLVADIARVTGWRAPDGDGRAELEAWTAGGREDFERGLKLAPAPALPEGAVVLHCWRGGLRSQSVTALVRALGLERAFVLDGGYRAYRRAVVAELERFRCPPAFVLRGLTGVGKTLVLRELERLEPGWVVDLERLAGHRSSILGMVGLEPRTQRAFESHLAARLRCGFDGPVVFEGESRKVGDAIIPASVWSGLDGGVNLQLVASQERRIEVLCADYLSREENRAHLRRQLPFIEQRLGPRRFDGALVELLDERREHELVEILLERYYDPLYGHSEERRGYSASFDASEPARAAGAIRDWIAHEFSPR